MGRCKSAGECVICQNECLTYDEFGYFRFLDQKAGDPDDIVCFGMDPDRSEGTYYPTGCYQKYLELCLRKRVDYLDLTLSREACECVANCI